MFFVDPIKSHSGGAMALYFEYKYAVLSKLICLVPKFHTNWRNLGPYKSTLNTSELLSRTWLRRKGAGMVSWQFVHYWFPDWAVRVWTRVEVNVSCVLSGQDLYRISSLPIDIIIHQTHYEKPDWLRAFNQFTIACELDMILHLSCQVQRLPGY